MLQGLRQLQSRSLGHVDIKEHHVNGILLELFNSLAHASSFGHDLGLPKLVQQELEFRTCGGLVVDNHGFQH